MAKRARSSKKPWQQRLSAGSDRATRDLLASIDVDAALYKYDIAGSVAHARQLREIGVLTHKELAAIVKGLKGIAADIEAGRLRLDPDLEDIHMVIESALVRRIGQPGRKLHTGRSRNDQVALDLRLWARDAVDELVDLTRSLQRAFVALAGRQGRIVMPAYTHLQRAQPALAGHALLAYVEMLDRDAERLAECRKRVNACPLGSGAVAGTSIPLNRRRVAELLGFPAVTRNSIDATSDRDFLAELCFDLAMLAVHLSRWAEDWIIYSSTEFGFIELDDAYCTSSSMMPQKKNADTLELIRAKSANAIAQLVGLLTLIKSLSSGYSRDLQDDKRFAFSAVTATKSALAVAAGIVSTASFRPERIAAGLEAGFLDATALAEYLVSKGVAFRSAHQIVGRLVARAEKAGKTLAELPLADLRAACDKIGPDVGGYLGAANVVKRYAPEGSGGAKQLRKQLAFWKKKLC
ncbi:MAG TPA: argininosuccinate lyase [Phycisphaerae bacterium]|nr:argininosuccinate lyase [Phycisphaerae bacterium]